VLAIGRELVSANGITCLESYPNGPSRTVPSWNVSWACSVCQARPTCHVTVSSQWSRQQHFTLLSRAGDVNSRPSQSASSQQSVLGYPLQSSRMEGSRHGHPQRYSNMTVLPAFPPEIHPSAAAGTDLNSDSASGRLNLLVATSYQERYVRLKPQDLTLRRRQQSPRRDPSTISSGATGASPQPKENRPDPLVVGASIPASARPSLVPHDFNFE